MFASLQEYVARLDDVGFWRPYGAEILRRHGMADPARAAVAGSGATWPTMVCGDVVVKLFGHYRSWRTALAAERAAYAVLASDPAIDAPRMLADGRLYDDADAPWPYLVTTRMRGVPWRQARLSAAQRLTLASELGRQVRRVHALCPQRAATHEDWAAPWVAAAARQSSLPAHLAAQVEGYLARLGPHDPVFVHGDLMFRHVFVEDGRLAGMIDWGDAMVTDRHYELVKLHLDLFDGDKALLRAFLDASDWPVDGEFARKAMAFALCRQAHGLTQHHAMDVFYTLPGRLPLAEVGTLDELADALFAV